MENRYIENKINLAIDLLNEKNQVDVTFYLMQTGNFLDKLKKADKTEKNLISDCKSKIWIVIEEKKGLMYFKGESEAKIISGLLRILFTIFNFETKEDILKTKESFIDKLELNNLYKITMKKLFNSMKNKLNGKAN